VRHVHGTLTKALVDRAETGREGMEGITVKDLGVVIDGGALARARREAEEKRAAIAYLHRQAGGQASTAVWPPESWATMQEPKSQDTSACYRTLQP
jgi:fatty acid-binding protein DegV